MHPCATTAPCASTLVTLPCSRSTSPPIHLCKLLGLAPGTTYYYTVGDGTNMSPEYSFTTLAAALPATGVQSLMLLLEMFAVRPNCHVCLLTRITTKFGSCTPHRQKQRPRRMSGAELQH